MNYLFWETTGLGDRNLILLHGWGLNAKIWSYVIPILSDEFRLHLVDLPGYGRSYRYGCLTLEQMVKEISHYVPKNSIVLGWSFGGLIAIMIAYLYPYIVDGIITVASSPKFCSSNNWPGIKLSVLKNFSKEMNLNFSKMINRFLSIQVLGSKLTEIHIHKLKNLILSCPIPSKEVLNNGLMILSNTDLRMIVNKINIPLLHFYGNLDSLVPSKVIPLISSLNSRSKSIVFNNAAHIPFISHTTLFCKEISKFNYNITKNF